MKRGRQYIRSTVCVTAVLLLAACHDDDSEPQVNAPPQPVDTVARWDQSSWDEADRLWQESAPGSLSWDQPVWE